MIDDENFENFFKNADKINPLPTLPKNFKDFFKNAETITEIPPIPKGLDTKHLQEFIDEFKKNRLKDSDIK